MKFASMMVGGAARVAMIENGLPTKLLPATVQDIADVVAMPHMPGTATESFGGPAVFSAPVRRPCRNIFCVGKNYHEHAHEFARSGFDSSAASGAVPEAPIIFSKVPECVIGPGADIVFDPAVSTAIDYEGELAVIIGKGGRAIPHARALEHVWGSPPSTT